MGELIKPWWAWKAEVRSNWYSGHYYGYAWCHPEDPDNACAIGPQRENREDAIQAFNEMFGPPLYGHDPYAQRCGCEACRIARAGV